MATGKIISGIYATTGQEVPIAVDDAGNLIIKQFGSNTLVHDTTVSWGNSATAGTVQTVDIPLPTDLVKDGKYEIVITNPSAETALTVSAKNKETFGTTAKYPQVTSFGVPISTPDGTATVVEGWLLGEAGRLTLSNDAATGLSGAFTAEIRVRKV